MAKKSVNTTKLAKKATTKNNSNTSKSTTTSKNTSSNETKKPESKIDELKARALELINDIDGDLTPEKVESITDIVKNKPENVSWLKDEVDKLTADNEKLRNEAADAKKNYQDLYNKYQQSMNNTQTESVSFNENDEIKKGVVELYDEFESVHRAGNFDRILLKHLLGKMRNKFDFVR